MTMYKKTYIPFHEMIIYKVHVRGYTMQRGSKVCKKGTFLGLQDKISYWKSLGVNAIELMPAYDFKEEGSNYWGYTDGDYFAPKASYCASEAKEQEVKAFVEALHKEKMECIMDFYFPSECTPELVRDVLQFWKKEYDIDGFVVYGPAVQFDFLAKDEVLADTKLFCAGYDMSKIYSKAPRVKRLAEYNTNFQSCMRRFLKGDRDQISSFIHFQRENPETHGEIHYVANHDGFTLADMVSYDYRHNEANGEDNLDGSYENHSWNCGVEGPTRKKSVLELRERQMRNAMMLLILSQATPLIYAGDEFGNSQKGNNNAYCQDNEIGWTDWRKTKQYAGFTKFVGDLIEFRKNHPILHMPGELKMADARGYGYPEISYHSEEAWYADTTGSSRHIAVLYCGSYAKKADGSDDDFIYIIYNMHYQEKEFALPKLPKNKNWYLAADSGRIAETAICPAGKEELIAENKYLKADGRSILVLIGK